MIGSYINTLKNTLNHPRAVVDGFIEGDRKSSQHPFIYCLIGIVVVIMMNTLLVDFSFTPQLSEIETEDEQVQQMAEWIKIANIRASTQFLPLMMFLLMIPMLSLPGLFFFRDEFEGFYSNLILNSYTVGSSMVALLALIPVWILADLPFTDPFMNSTLPAVLMASVGIWIYKQYFMVSSLMGWIKILSSYITGYVLFVILKGFTAGVTGYMIFAVKRILELAGS